MRKILCLFIGFISVINNSKAQKASLGLNAGATLASYKADIESISLTSKTKVGFSAGLTASMPINKNFSFRPQLNFVQKGGKQKDEDYTDELTLNYIELPLNFVFNTSTSKGMFFIGAGPSLNMGLSGKDKWVDHTESGNDDIKFGSGDDADFKSFEAGVNILAGYQFKGGFFLTANYNAALSNAAPDDPEFDGKYHNRYFGISIGYMFSGKAK
jgi:hypothetical protein